MWGRVVPAIVALLVLSPNLNASDLTIFGSNYQLSPRGLSADKSTLIGAGLVPPLGASEQGMVWTAAAGLDFMPSPGAVRSSIPVSISANGSVIAGYNRDDNNNLTAWRWTATGGYQDVAPAAAGSYTQVTGISGDGNTVVGASYTSPNYLAFVWTAAGGAVSLPLNNVTNPLISADGSTVICSTNEKLYQWTPTGGVAPLQTLANTVNIEPGFVSPNGSLVLGDATDKKNNWFMFQELNGVMSKIPSPSFSADLSNPNPDVLGATADGSEMIGLDSGFDPTTNTAVGTPWFWSQATGFETIQDYLASAGIDLSTYNIANVLGISLDGTELYGAGYESGSVFPSSWIATVPEPSAVAIGAVALVMVRRRR